MKKPLVGMFPEGSAPLLVTLHGATRGTALTVTRGLIGGKIVPSSPAVIDTFAGDLMSCSAQTDGVAWIDVSRSINSDDPVNQDAIDDAIAAGTDPPPAVYTNIRWWPARELWKIPAPGSHPPPGWVLEFGNKARYIQYEIVRGAVKDFEPYGH